VAMIHKVEDLAKYGYQLNMKVKIWKHPSMFLATLFEPLGEIWRFFLNLGRIMAIENLQKALNFSAFNF
jgi:hypothetical protein